MINQGKLLLSETRSLTADFSQSSGGTFLSLLGTTEYGSLNISGAATFSGILGLQQGTLSLAALPAARIILHMQGANTPGDWAMIDPARGYECISHGLHMTCRLQERGRVGPYVAMGIPDVFRWRGEPKTPGSVAVMPRKGDDVYRAVREALPHVTFVPIDGLGEREAAERLKSADVFLAISAREALGLPPLEAMCAACAVVGFPGVGGFEFMRHLETALVVPNGDVTALVAALGWVLADRGLRDGLRDRGRVASSSCTVDRERRSLLRALGLPEAAGDAGDSACATCPPRRRALLVRPHLGCGHPAGPRQALR